MSNAFITDHVAASLFDDIGGGGVLSLGQPCDCAPLLAQESKMTGDFVCGVEL
jgi:hypothetical protein